MSKKKEDRNDEINNKVTKLIILFLVDKALKKECEKRKNTKRKS